MKMTMMMKITADQTTRQQKPIGSTPSVQPLAWLKRSSTLQSPFKVGELFFYLMISIGCRLHSFFCSNSMHDVGGSPLERKGLPKISNTSKESFSAIL